MRIIMQVKLHTFNSLNAFTHIRKDEIFSQQKTFMSLFLQEAKGYVD